MGAMGICISTSTIHPNIIKGTTVTNKEKCVDVEISVETELSVSSADTSNCAQYSEVVSQKTRRKPEDDVVDNMLNNAIDWSSEEEHSNEHQASAIAAATFGYWVHISTNYYI